MFASDLEMIKISFVMFKITSKCFLFYTFRSIFHIIQIGFEMIKSIFFSDFENRQLEI